MQSGMHWFVGGGIAALAGAVFLVEDAGVPGEDIRIIEALDLPGGSLDGSGSASRPFLTRGGRMFEPHFVCTHDLLDRFPAPDFPDRSIWEDIIAFNRGIGASSRCRLVRSGRCDPGGLNLGLRDVLALNRLLLTPEARLGDRTIEACFPRSFFDTNFWLMWSTMFAFLPWHSAVEMRRYMRRFIHMFPGLARLEGVLRTRYNQYDSIVAPIAARLAERGVRLEAGAVVEDLDIVDGRVTGIRLADGGLLEVAPQDRVYLTLGSMTDASTTGTNTTVPPPHGNSPSFELWKRLAARHPGFGRPAAFCSDTGRTAWMSFTASTKNPKFLDLLTRFTGNAPGTGGLVTFVESGWLLSIVAFHQPHFRAQPADTQVFWGYGLRGGRPGDKVASPMWDCTGDEILEEVAHQLGLGSAEEAGLADAEVVTCIMPFITSQFMPRKAGDRPEVCPPGIRNLALMGQFCELPRDTVFTVEYSVRSARAAVAALNGTPPPPPVKRTDLEPMTLLRAVRTMAGF